MTGNHSLEQQLETARAQIEALRRYAWHKRDCQVDAHVHPTVPCSCGFADVIASLKRGEAPEAREAVASPATGGGGDTA